MTDRHWLVLIAVGVGLFLLYLAGTAGKGYNYNDCDNDSRCSQHFYELECGPNGLYLDDPEMCP